MKKIIIGITGASGSIQTHRLIETLLMLDHEVHLVATAHGEKVCAFELEKPFQTLVEEYQALNKKFFFYSNDDLFAPIASGSFKTDGMVILPCSMGTLAKVACGISDSLLTRAADVAIKENRRLILAPRESPFSTIHLGNMLKLSRLGVIIMPMLPAFYLKPKTLEESINNGIGRLLESLGIQNPYYKTWSGAPYGE